MIVKNLPTSHSHNLGQYLATGSKENEESFITNQRGQKTLDEIKDRLLELAKTPEDPHDSEESTSKPLA